MSSTTQLLGVAFSGHPVLEERVHNAIGEQPLHYGNK